MKRYESIFKGLAGMVNPDEAASILGLPIDCIRKCYKGDETISLRCLLKRVCRSNAVLDFPAIGEPTYSLSAVRELTGKGRSWTLEFIKRNRIRSWCTGTHYQYSKCEVDIAWNRESSYWCEWIPLKSVPCVYGIGLRLLLQQVSICHVRTRSGNREQLVSLKDVRKIWKTREE